MVEFDEELDVRGKVCPMPVLETQKKLDEMEEGQVLKVIGDYPPAKDNIRRFAEENGHEVVAIEDEGDHFVIYIRKGTGG
ncbi:MAG: sulfurtransferase TusA family protein [Methanopyri archaeon]|nr:sulfurtransferase TusA family protein [Methanopyri archaeon]